MGFLLRCFGGKKYFNLILLFLSVPFLVYGIVIVSKYIIRASVAPANIVINASSQSYFVPNWQSFSQGGESYNNMIRPAVAEIRKLQPKFIRIDHLFDFYQIVTRDVSGKLIFNFTKLDEVVADIKSTGATPFFSVSYMPDAIASSDIISLPRNWDEWSLVVQRLIEHYSGRNNLNLIDVYYEIWNEPDLFGGFKYYGDKNYLTLYQYAALGAARSQNVNFFKLGGPAITAFYPSWFEGFLKFTANNNLKLDFISWHCYNRNPQKFLEDTQKLDEILKNFPQYQNLERHITEFGFNSEVDGNYDTIYSAYHAAAVYAKLKNRVYQAHLFELVDGLSPKGDVFWGRWGLLTHESKGLVEKPRFALWSILNTFSGYSIMSSSGENDYISVLPMKISNSVWKIMIVNFDPDNIRVENVPILVQNLPVGKYHFDLTYPLVSAVSVLSFDLDITGDFSSRILLDHNSLGVITLTRI